MARGSWTADGATAKADEFETGVEETRAPLKLGHVVVSTVRERWCSVWFGGPRAENDLDTGAKDELGQHAPQMQVLITAFDCNQGSIIFWCW